MRARPFALLQLAILEGRVQNTDERLDVLHSDIGELRGDVRVLDSKLDQLTVDVAKLTVTSGPGLTLSPKAIKVIGGILAAVILAVANALTGATAGEEAKPATVGDP